jgi:hypothetical protein
MEPGGGLAQGGGALFDGGVGPNPTLPDIPKLLEKPTLHSLKLCRVPVLSHTRPRFDPLRILVPMVTWHKIGDDYEFIVVAEPPLIYLDHGAVRRLSENTNVRKPLPGCVQAPWDGDVLANERPRSREMHLSGPPRSAHSLRSWVHIGWL